MAKPQNIKLIYFDLPGRAECSRILLAYAGVPYENQFVTRDEWPELKNQMPFGQVPVLEVDGKMLAQSSAIERYAAKLAGLIPEDQWEAAKVDEAVALINEIDAALMPSFYIQDLDAKIKARQELLEGSIKTKLESCTKLIKNSGGQWLTGQLTYADILLYKGLSGLVSGVMDGIPSNLLDSYPELKEHHNRVAALPAVASMYEHITEGSKLSYKPLP